MRSHRGAGRRRVYRIDRQDWVAADDGGWIRGTFRTRLGALIARATR